MCHMSGVTCHVSCVMCHVSCVMCQMSGVWCHVSPVACNFKQTLCSRGSSTITFVTRSLIQWPFSSKPSKHHYTQTVRARELTCWENVHPPPRVTWHMSCVMCHVSCVMCHVSCVMCHVSCVLCPVSRVTCHLSLMPTATATDPLPANSLIIHSRLAHSRLAAYSIFNI